MRQRWVLIRHESKLAAVWTVGLNLDPVIDAESMEGVEACQGLVRAGIERLKANRTLLLFYYFLLVGALPLWLCLGSWPLGEAGPWCHGSRPSTGPAGTQLVPHTLHNLFGGQPRQAVIVLDTNLSQSNADVWPV